MTQSTWKARTRVKQEIKNAILWFVGCHATIQTPNGPLKAKEVDSRSSFQEMWKFFNSRNIGFRDGRNYSEKECNTLRRTLYRYIEELKEEGFMESSERGVYALTPAGQKRWTFINVLFSTDRLPVMRPIGTFFNFGPKIGGKTQYVNILVSVGDPNLIDLLEKDMEKKGMKQIDDEQSRTNELGWALSTVIYLHIKGLFSVIRQLAKGKEEAFMEILSKIPTYKAQETN